MNEKEAAKAPIVELFEDLIQRSYNLLNKPDLKPIEFCNLCATIITIVDKKNSLDSQGEYSSMMKQLVNRITDSNDENSEE